MRQPQTIKSICVEARLKTQTLNEFRKDLIEKVSMPELYRSDNELWWNIINEVYPESMFNSWSERYKLYHKEFNSYYKSVTQTQKRFDQFVLFMEEKSGPVNMGYIKVLGIKGVEDYCLSFGVDRATALKMKSLYDGKVVIEPEWIPIESF
jgi:hypothetical protein